MLLADVRCFRLPEFLHLIKSLAPLCYLSDHKHPLSPWNLIPHSTEKEQDGSKIPSKKKSTWRNINSKQQTLERQNNTWISTHHEVLILPPLTNLNLNRLRVRPWRQVDISTGLGPRSAAHVAVLSALFCPCCYL